VPLRTDAVSALLTARLVLAFALEREAGRVLADPVRVEPTAEGGGWIFAFPGGVAVGVIDVDGDERRALVWCARVTRGAIASRLYSRAGRLLREGTRFSPEVVRLDRALRPPPFPELN
jgi:hypothetical protein